MPHRQPRPGSGPGGPPPGRPRRRRPRRRAGWQQQAIVWGAVAVGGLILFVVIKATGSGADPDLPRVLQYESTSGSRPPRQPPSRFPSRPAPARPAEQPWFDSPDERTSSDVAVVEFGNEDRHETEAVVARGSETEDRSDEPALDDMPLPSPITERRSRGKTIVVGEMPDRVASENVVEYIDQLDSAFTDARSDSELGANLKVIPDAYRYYMAKGLRELGFAGFEGAEFRRRVRRLHEEYVSYKGKFLLSLTAESQGNTVFFQKNGKHFELRDSRRRTLKLLESRPELRYEAWTIFEHPPDARRIIRRQPLALFKRHELVFLVSSIKLEDRDPFTLTLRHIVAQRPGNAMDGINLKQRQLSCVRFRDLLVPAMDFRVYPSRVKIPEPPADFEEILESL